MRDRTVYWATHRERAKATTKAWRDNNPKRARMAEKQWRDNHPLEVRCGRAARAANAAARKYGQLDRIDGEQVKQLWLISDQACGVCRQPLDAKWSLDHIIPFVTDGRNVITNCQFTHFRCNSIKGGCSGIVHIKPDVATAPIRAAIRYALPCCKCGSTEYYAMSGKCVGCSKAWSKNNRQRMLVNAKAWQHAHPLQYQCNKLVSGANRAARAYGQTSRITVAEVKQMWVDSCGFCAICGLLAWSLDHRISFRTGGINEICNCQVSHKECNQMKA